MKTVFKLLPITFFALLLFTSCQDEITEETQISEQELLVANSELVNLMKSTVASNGSTGQTGNNIDHIDFRYQISFSIYNASFQIIETAFIENDMQLDQFLQRIENSDSGALLVTLNFPVTMIYIYGETIEVSNNQELVSVLSDDGGTGGGAGNGGGTGGGDLTDCEDLGANIGDACTTDAGEQGFVTEDCECETE